MPRVSQLPRQFSCPQSRHKPKVEIQNDDKYARLGSAAHEHQALVITNGLTVVNDVESLAKKWRLEPEQADDLEFYCWRGISMWQQLSKEIEVIATEQEMISPALDLTGHCDLLAVSKAEKQREVIVDWKTGYRRGDENIQLQGYAVLRSLIRGAGNEEPITCMAVFLRDGTTVTEEMCTDDIAQWVERYEETLKSNAYRPGEHCQYCPRNHECDALATDSKNALSLLTTGDSSLAPHEQMARLYPQTRELKAQLERYESALRAILAQHPEGLNDGNGKILSLEKATKQEIKGDAVDLISSVEGWRTAIKIGKTALLDLVAEAAPRGKKKEEKEKLMAVLEEAGFVETSECSKITSRKEE